MWLTNSSSVESPRSAPPNSMMPSFHVRGKFIAERTARHAHNRELLGQQVILAQVKERRQQFALRQVAGGPKDHHDPRIGNPLIALGKLRKILGPNPHLYRCHLTPRLISDSLRWNREPRLRFLHRVTAELVAHDGQHPVREVIFFPRSDSANQRTL